MSLTARSCVFVKSICKERTGLSRLVRFAHVVEDWLPPLRLGFGHWFRLWSPSRVRLLFCPRVTDTYPGFFHQYRPHIATKHRAYRQCASVSLVYCVGHDASTTCIACVTEHSLESKEKSVHQSRLKYICLFTTYKMYNKNNNDVIKL